MSPKEQGEGFIQVLRGGNVMVVQSAAAGQLASADLWSHKAEGLPGNPGTITTPLNGI